MRNIFYLIFAGLFFGIVPFEACSQQNYPFQFGYASDSNSFYVIPELSLIHNQLSSNSYLDSRVNLVHLDESIGFKGSISFNQSESFDIVNSKLAVILPGNRIIGPGALQAHPSRYTMSIPVGLSSWMTKDPFHIYTSLTVLNEESVIDTPELITSGGNNLINWNEVIDERTNFILSGLFMYNSRSWNVGLGVSNFTLFKSGSIDSTFNFSDHVVPYLYLGYKHDAFKLYSRSYVNEYQFTLQHPLDFLSLPVISSSRMEISYQIGIDSYDYTKLSAGLYIPLGSNFSGFVRYQNLWGSRNNFDNLEFENWRESIIWNNERNIVEYVPHSSLNAGIRIPLVQSRFSKITVNSGELLIPHLYSSKIDYYTEHPIARVKIRNDDNEDIDLSITAQSSDGTASYRSPIYQVGSHSEKWIPVYFYSPFAPENTYEKNIQYNVTMHSRGKNANAASFNITLLGPNSWNGDVDDLIHFIERDQTLVRSRAMSIYLKTSEPLNRDSVTVSSTQIFTELARYLTTIGEDMKYINDQVQSYRVDQVQYPLETLESRGGDCEDLVVYLASHLMSLGHTISVVDLRPRLETETTETGQNQLQENLGHLFILVDTNIPSENAGRIGLEDLSFLSRRNKFGDYTIWIPIEATVIDQGFNKAWKTGIQQYYNHVVNPTELKKEFVQIIDF